MKAFNKQTQRKQVLQSNIPRTTRQQFDTKNNSRQTLNSKNKTLLSIDEQIILKKKQKTQHIDNMNQGMVANKETDEKIPDTITSVEVNKENVSNNNLNYSDDEESEVENNLNIKYVKVSGTDDVLGEGHTEVLAAFVREKLFKNIKFLAPNHLESKGGIMQSVLKLLKYSESKNGNLTAFITASKIEIRKTMCSRRGYVKRKTLEKLSGKFLSNNTIETIVRHF
jgi:hypothetical protein